MSDPLLRLRYTLTAADQIAKLQRYADTSKAARWFPAFAYCVIVGLSWLSAALFYFRQGDRNLAYLAAGLLALFLTLCLPWLYRRYQDGFFASALSDDQQRGLVGAFELVVGQEGIEEIGPVTSTQSAWSEVRDLEVEKQRTFIVIAPLIAFMVPHSAFPDERSITEFQNLVRQRIAGARA